MGFLVAASLLSYALYEQQRSPTNSSAEVRTVSQFVVLSSVTPSPPTIVYRLPSQSSPDPLMFDEPMPIPTPTPLPPLPAQVSAAAPPPIHGGSFEPNVERWRGLVERFFVGWTVDKVLTIMTCESHGNPTAENGVHKGLMQVSQYWHQAKADALFGPGANLFDPEVNIAVSRVISDGEDFSAWECQ